MRDIRNNNGQLQSDHDHMTPIGKIVRKLSLDELPQLINILKGEMSFVGPRPLLPEYLPLYTKEQNRRHHVRPGITGWAQINGRNTISWQEKFKFDVYYVEHQNFFLDLKILFLTVGKVFYRGMSMRVNSLLWKNSMEKTEYIFIGAGGHARVMASVIESNQDTLLAVFDNDLNIKEMDGIKNAGQYQLFIQLPSLSLLLAIMPFVKKLVEN